MSILSKIPRPNVLQVTGGLGLALLTACGPSGYNGPIEETPPRQPRNTAPTATLVDCYRSAANSLQQGRCRNSSNYNATININRAETLATAATNPNPPRQVISDVPLRTICRGTKRLECIGNAKEGLEVINTVNEAAQTLRQLGLNF